LDIDIRPLCSTASVLFQRMKTKGIIPTKPIAGLMLSCILSDSLEFRSPTTTQLDIDMAKELAPIAGLDISTHAAGMFEAKADISALSPKEVILMDSKKFDIGGKALRVSVVETTSPNAALSQVDTLREAATKMVKDEGIDDVVFFVVDILKEEATYVATSDSSAAIVEKAWNGTCDSEGLLVLPGVLSRKKQMIPTLEESMNESLAASAWPQT